MEVITDWCVWGRGEDIISPVVRHINEMHNKSWSPFCGEEILKDAAVH